MDMTKFEHEEDPGFMAVAGELRRWTRTLSTPSDVLVEGEAGRRETNVKAQQPLYSV